MSIVRRNLFTGYLDPTEADQAIDDLVQWPGGRFSHRNLLERAWDL